MSNDDATLAQLELPDGMAAAHRLPHRPFSDLWEAIFVEGDVKDRLLAQSVLCFTLRPRVDLATLPLHGFILLVGPPGTGKTSLARGLASRTAETFRGLDGFQYMEVEPHSLARAALGRSQQATKKLFAEVIPERAQLGPLIVLLDEVETLAADRYELSLKANPVDVHRATDAVLASLDQLAAAYPKLLFVATSNFPEAIDDALMSRADLIERIPLPGPEIAARILVSSIEALGKVYPTVTRICDDPGFARAAVACRGLDGRQIRKIVLSACALDKQTALDPGRLTLGDLVRAAESARRGKRK